MKNLLFLFISLTTLYSYSQTWEDVGGGTNNSSHGMLVWNGQLVNLGSYNNPCQRVSTWDGTSWQCLGGGVGIVARAGCVWDGKLVVIGDFWNNFQPCVGCNGVAVWDGTSWSALDDGFNNDVLTCTVWNGDLIIGGDFTQTNGVPCSRVVRWDVSSSTFISMGAPSDFTNDVRCMVEYDGDLWVGGDFNNVGGCSPCDGLVKWDVASSTWTGGNSGVDLVGGVNESVRVLYVNPNDGNLYMGGEFPELHDGDAASENFDMSGIAMYDGSNWFPLGTGLNEYCRAIHEYNGNVIAGGYFTSAGGVPANKIAKWNPTTSTWSAMGQGFDGVGVDEYVKSATVWNGIFFAGGAYTQAEGGPMNYIAQWYEPVINPPVASITNSTSSGCEGICVNFSDNSTNSPTSWTWAFPGGSSTSSSSQNPGSICFASAGTFTVELEACNANGCNTTTIDITVGTIPTLSVNDETICNGNSATLTATPSVSGGSFNWISGSETTDNIVVSPTSLTSYSVEYTLNGCTSTQESGTVTVTPTPSVNITGANTICDNESITLTATPSLSGGSYSWTPNNETTSSITDSPNNSTNYGVIYTLNGCSSPAASVMINVNPTYNLTESETICEGATINYPDGSSAVISGNTSHINSMSTLLGCDSIITTNVLMSPNYNLTENETICEGAIINYPDGNSEVINGNTSHISNMSSILGCDSIITTNVTMGLNYNLTEDVTQCSGSNYTYPDGSTSTDINTSESHVSNLQSINGCDSIITTNITINPTPINTVSETNNILTSNQNGGNYQWINCDEGNANIPNETNQSYTPINNGNYAVEINLNGCSSTSECINISTIGINDLNDNIFSIYPNPAKNTIVITSSLSLNNLSYSIYDSQGRLVHSGLFKNNGQIVISDLTPGSYILRVNNTTNILFIKQ